jgi:hypothetical protein
LLKHPLRFFHFLFLRKKPARKGRHSVCAMLIRALPGHALGLRGRLDQRHQARRQRHQQLHRQALVKS